jgi:hypothetical protein
MKTRHLKIMILAGAAIALAITLPANAQRKGPNEPGWNDVKNGGPGPRPALTEERIDRIMNRMKEADPAKAEEMEKLRETDPNAFRAALKEMIHERFREKMLLGDVNRPGPGFGPRGEKFRERMRGRGEEYLDWLKANAPEEAERLAELKKNIPELYKRQLWLGARKYGRIAEAAQENPELAKVLKEDLELRNKSFDILRKIRATTDEAEKQKLTAELEQVVSERFDVILQRKQMEYDQLRQEIERLQEQVKQNEAQLEKWKANKADRVKARVKELLNRTEKFEWE